MHHFEKSFELIHAYRKKEEKFEGNTILICHSYFEKCLYNEKEFEIQDKIRYILRKRKSQ